MPTLLLQLQRLSCFRYTNQLYKRAVMSKVSSQVASPPKSSGALRKDTPQFRLILHPTITPKEVSGCICRLAPTLPPRITQDFKTRRQWRATEVSIPIASSATHGFQDRCRGRPASLRSFLFLRPIPRVPHFYLKSLSRKRISLIFSR